LHKENKNKAIQIINKLKEYYNLKNDVDFAEYLGIPSTTLSSWKSRDSIDYDLVYSKCVGIDANWILTGAGNMLISTRENSQNSLLKMEDNIKNKYILQLENENRRLLVDNERKQELINLFINGDITTSKRKKLTKRMVI